MDKIYQAFNKFYEEHRKDLINLLRQVPSVVNTVRELKELVLGENYRLVIPSDILKQIREGTARFGKSATRGWTANIHDIDTGKIIGQISIEKVFPELADSFNRMAIQSSLAEISHSLKSIETKLDRICQGQYDDILGLLDSGENLYARAIEAVNQETRRLLLTNAMSQVSEARGKLIRSFETDIQSLNNIPTTTLQIIWKSLVKDIPQTVEKTAHNLENKLIEIVRASYIFALSCGQLDELALLNDSWQPLEILIPKAQAAQEIIQRWLPGNPYMLPDRFTTLLSMADNMVRTEKQLASGEFRTLELDFRPSEIIKDNDV